MEPHENRGQFDATSPALQQTVADSALESPAVVPEPTIISPGQTANPASASMASQPPRRRLSMPRLRIIIIGAVIVFAIIGTLLLLQRHGKTTSSATGNFNTITLDLNKLEPTSQLSTSQQTVTVNGQLRANGSVVISPSLQPANGTPGQLYYDQTANQLAYFNGSQFVTLGTSTTNVQNSTTVVNNSTTTINGALNAVTSPGGTPGFIAKFTGSNSLGNSIISDDGTNATIFGNLNLANPTPGAPMTVWPDSTTPVTANFTDPTAVEVGLKFQTDVGGVVSGMRFYKGPLNTGPHVGNLWTSGGVNLATVTFTNETASGWQTATFTHGVSISANTTYIISYHTTVGEYAADVNYLSFGGFDNPPLHILQDGADGGNGVFSVSATSTFPTRSVGNGANYWVDLIFTPSSTPNLYEVNGAPISSGNLANNYDIAKRSSGQVFTGINTFRNVVDSSGAFVIQNAASTPLFTADTAGSQIFISKLTVVGKLTVDQHIAGGGGTPTIVAGPAACTTPSAAINGSDTSGLITVTSGTGCAGTGKLATVTFSNAYDTPPHVVLTPANAGAAGLSFYVDNATISATAFDIQVAAGAIASTTPYEWYYQVIQ